MMGHLIVGSMDADNPASLSEIIIQDTLRKDLGFEGIVITDAMQMGALTDNYIVEEAAVKAVLAGNDMLCCTDFEFQIPAVIQAVEHGQIPEEQIDQAVLRILLLKEKLGLI